MFVDLSEWERERSKVRTRATYGYRKSIGCVIVGAYISPLRRSRSFQYDCPSFVPLTIMVQKSHVAGLARFSSIRCSRTESVRPSSRNLIHRRVCFSNTEPDSVQFQQWHFSRPERRRVLPYVLRPPLLSRPVTTGTHCSRSGYFMYFLSSVVPFPPLSYVLLDWSSLIRLLSPTLNT